MVHPYAGKLWEGVCHEIKNCTSSTSKRFYHWGKNVETVHVKAITVWPVQVNRDCASDLGVTSGFTTAETIPVIFIGVTDSMLETYACYVIDLKKFQLKASSRDTIEASPVTKHIYNALGLNFKSYYKNPYLYS